MLSHSGFDTINAANMLLSTHVQQTNHHCTDAQEIDYQPSECNSNLEQSRRLSYACLHVRYDVNEFVHSQTAHVIRCCGWCRSKLWVLLINLQLLHIDMKWKNYGSAEPIVTRYEYWTNYKCNISIRLSRSTVRFRIANATMSVHVNEQQRKQHANLRACSCRPPFAYKCAANVDEDATAAPDQTTPHARTDARHRRHTIFVDARRVTIHKPHLILLTGMTWVQSEIKTCWLCSALASHNVCIVVDHCCRQDGHVRAGLSSTFELEAIHAFAAGFAATVRQRTQNGCAPHGRPMHSNRLTRRANNILHTPIRCGGWILIDSCLFNEFCVGRTVFLSVAVTLRTNRNHTHTYTQTQTQTRKHPVHCYICHDRTTLRWRSGWLQFNYILAAAQYKGVIVINQD